MNTDLERRYRRLLTLLPKQYREERGEEMTGAFLDAAEEKGGNRTWPDLREVLSLAALAVRVRTTAAAATERAGLAKPEVARLVALCGAFYLGVMGIAAFVDYSVWGAGPFRPVWDMTLSTGSSSPVILAVAFHFESQILWALVFVALAAGLWRTGRVLAVIVASCSLATATAAAVLWETPLMVLVVAAVLVTPARRPMAGRRAAWLAATLPMLVLGVCNVRARVASSPGARLDRVSALVAKLPQEPMWFGTAAVVAVVAAVFLWNRGSAAWPLAMAVVGTQPILLHMEQMVFRGYFFHDHAIEMVWLSEICLVAAEAARLLARRRRAQGGGAAALA